MSERDERQQAHEIEMRQIRREGQTDARLYQTLGRLESKIDSIEEKARDTKEYAQDISERVRSLEVSRGWFIGAGAGAGALTAWLTGIIS